MFPHDWYELEGAADRAADESSHRRPAPELSEDWRSLFEEAGVEPTVVVTPGDIAAVELPVAAGGVGVDAGEEPPAGGTPPGGAPHAGSVAPRPRMLRRGLEAIVNSERLRPLRAAYTSIPQWVRNPGYVTAAFAGAGIATNLAVRFIGESLPYNLEGVLASIAAPIAASVVGQYVINRIAAGNHSILRNVANYLAVPIAATLWGVNYFGDQAAIFYNYNFPVLSGVAGAVNAIPGWIKLTLGTGFFSVLNRLADSYLSRVVNRAKDRVTSVPARVDELPSYLANRPKSIFGWWANYKREVREEGERRAAEKVRRAAEEAERKAALGESRLIHTYGSIAEESARRAARDSRRPSGPLQPGGAANPLDTAQQAIERLRAYRNTPQGPATGGE